MLKYSKNIFLTDHFFLKEIEASFEILGSILLLKWSLLKIKQLFSRDLENLQFNYNMYYVQCFTDLATCFAFEMFRAVSFVLAIYSQKEKIKKYKSVKLKRFLRFSIARISQIFEKKNPYVFIHGASRKPKQHFLMWRVFTILNQKKKRPNNINKGGFFFFCEKNDLNSPNFELKNLLDLYLKF